MTAECDKNLSNSNRKENFLIILCLIIGVALRFYTLDQKSLWIDEIHTYNDSKYNLAEQLKFYKENPTYLHPPLFFILTNLFYPFEKPERELRIIPLIFGTLSIPMLYILAKSFSPTISLPCTFSLTFMTYHIYFSQDGRMYSMVMFFAMVSLYLFMKHLETSKKKYLLGVAFIFSIMFHTSYSTILYIIFSQILWFYRINEKQVKPSVYSFITLISLTLIFCSPWVLFLLLNYHGQNIMDPLTVQDIGSLKSLIQNVLNDWVSHIPLMLLTVILLILFSILSKNIRNSMILITLFFLPIGGLYFYCKIFDITQFITSRYFISFLPIFFITLFLSLDTIDNKFKTVKKVFRPSLLFLTIYIVSNLFILPFYYRAEKQDFRGLVNYLNYQIRDGDKIIVGTFTYIPGILHYFKVYPTSRHYNIPYSWKDPGKIFEFKVPLISQNRRFTIYHSNVPYAQYVEDGSRLWILVGKEAAKEIRRSLPCILKGYFDGSFSNFRKFPSDASMYLFMWDPNSSEEKGIDIPIE